MKKKLIIALTAILSIQFFGVTNEVNIKAAEDNSAIISNESQSKEEYETQELKGDGYDILFTRVNIPSVIEPNNAGYYDSQIATIRLKNLGDKTIKIVDLVCNLYEELEGSDCRSIGDYPFELKPGEEIETSMGCFDFTEIPCGSHAIVSRYDFYSPRKTNWYIGIGISTREEWEPTEEDEEEATGYEQLYFPTVIMPNRTAATVQMIGNEYEKIPFKEGEDCGKYRFYFLLDENEFYDENIPYKITLPKGVTLAPIYKYGGTYQPSLSGNYYGHDIEASRPIYFDLCIDPKYKDTDLTINLKINGQTLTKTIRLVDEKDADEPIDIEQYEKKKPLTGSAGVYGESNQEIHLLINKGSGRMEVLGNYGKMGNLFNSTYKCIHSTLDMLYVDGKTYAINPNQFYYYDEAFWEDTVRDGDKIISTYTAGKVVVKRIVFLKSKEEGKNPNIVRCEYTIENKDSENHKVDYRTMNDILLGSSGDIKFQTGDGIIYDKHQTFEGEGVPEYVFFSNDDCMALRTSKFTPINSLPTSITVNDEIYYSYSYMTGLWKSEAADTWKDLGQPAIFMNWDDMDLKPGEIKSFGYEYELAPYSELAPKALEGDVNGDGVVNIEDLSLVASLYKERIEDDNYNLKMDVNEDDVIDIKDIVYVAKRIQ